MYDFQAECEMQKIIQLQIGLENDLGGVLVV